MSLIEAVCIILTIDDELTTIDHMSTTFGLSHERSVCTILTIDDELTTIDHMSTTFGISHERHNPWRSVSRGGFMGSMEEPPLDLPPSKILCTNVPYVDNQLLYSLCGLKRSHTCRLQTQQLGLAVSHPIFAISPQEYTRNDLRRSVILGGIAPRPP